MTAPSGSDGRGAAQVCFMRGNGVFKRGVEGQNPILQAETKEQQCCGHRHCQYHHHPGLHCVTSHWQDSEVDWQAEHVCYELLETDNLIRDTIAQLRKATSTINFNTEKIDLLQNEDFLGNLYSNLTQMFKSFESIYEVMEFDQDSVDNLVIETIDSLERFSNFRAF